MTDTDHRTHTGEPADTDQLTDTGQPAENDDWGLDCAAALVFAGVVVLSNWDDVTWAAWTAVVVGLLGLVLAPVAIHYADKRDNKISNWTWVGLGLITPRFLMDAWTFLF